MGFFFFCVFFYFYFFPFPLFFIELWKSDWVGCIATTSNHIYFLTLEKTSKFLYSNWFLIYFDPIPIDQE
jgi:hypothetical protein